MKLSPQHLALAFLGGALGTVLRFALSLTMPQLALLFLVNLVGAAFLGLVNSLPFFSSDSSRVFWGVGFAGGFTTMSGVALWLVVSSESALLAPITILVMFALGVLSYLAGLKVGKQAGRKTDKSDASS